MSSVVRGDPAALQVLDHTLCKSGLSRPPKETNQFIGFTILNFSQLGALKSCLLRLYYKARFLIYSFVLTLLENYYFFGYPYYFKR